MLCLPLPCWRCLSSDLGKLGIPDRGFASRGRRPTRQAAGRKSPQRWFSAFWRRGSAVKTPARPLRGPTGPGSSPLKNSAVNLLWLSAAALPKRRIMLRILAGYAGGVSGCLAMAGSIVRRGKGEIGGPLSSVLNIVSTLDLPASFTVCSSFSIIAFAFQLSIFFYFPLLHCCGTLLALAQRANSGTRVDGRRHLPCQLRQLRQLLTRGCPLPWFEFHPCPETEQGRPPEATKK